MTAALIVTRQRVLASLLLASALVAAGPASAAERQVEPATGRSRAVGVTRVALLIQPLPATASGRAAVAAADRDVLSRRLRAIGFDVWTVGPGERPDMVRDLRTAAPLVPEGAEVVVVSLGVSAGGPDDVFLLPAGAPPDLAGGSGHSETSMVRLGDVLRRLSERHLRNLVAIVDECRTGTAGRCALDATAGGSGASIIGAERVESRDHGVPLAAQASLREALLAATAEEGQALPDTYTLINRALSGSDLQASAGTRLSATFAFVPSGFFAGLPTECNRVDPEADPGTLRTAMLEPLARACEQAASEYPFARFFASRLGVVREQRAFQRAVSSCDDRLAAASYRSTYPAGRFLGVVESFTRDCERRSQDARDDQRRRDDEARVREAQRQEDQRRRDAERRDEELRRQEAERRAEEARRQQQAALQRNAPTAPQYHYIAGTDPRGWGWVALRMGPGRNFDWFRDVQLSEGTLLTVLGQNGPWTNVRLLNGRVGWTASEFIRCCRSSP